MCKIVVEGYLITGIGLSEKLKQLGNHSSWIQLFPNVQCATMPVCMKHSVSTRMYNNNNNLIAWGELTLIFLTYDHWKPY